MRRLGGGDILLRGGGFPRPLGGLEFLLHVGGGFFLRIEFPELGLRPAAFGGRAGAFVEEFGEFARFNVFDHRCVAGGLGVGEGDLHEVFDAALLGAGDGLRDVAEVFDGGE